MIIKNLRSILRYLVKIKLPILIFLFSALYIFPFLYLLTTPISKSEDATTGHATPNQGVAPHVWDGINFIGIRQASTADNTTGAGIEACGILGFDGTNYQVIAVDATGKLNINATINAGENVDIAIMGTAVGIGTGSSGITADTLLVSNVANRRLFNVSMRESAATASVATVILRASTLSGGNCNGNEIAYVELTGDESLQIQYGDRGLSIASGMCADVLAGTIDINVHTLIEAAP